MAHRVFITGSGLVEAALGLLRDRGCVFETGDPGDSSDDIARKLSAFDPEGLIVRQGRISPAVMDAAERLRVICKHGVGTDNIDIEAATSRRIPVMYTPGTNAESVAEHALGLILSLSRRIVIEDRRIRAAVYDKRAFGGLELAERTLGLVGLGRIASRLAELVAPLRMEIVAFDPYLPPEGVPAGVTRVDRLEELLGRADVVSIHCPLTPDTKHLIDQEALSRMKKSACIVNTARGGLIDEGALAEALRRGQLAGAALDVLEVEPPASDHPLLQLDNVVLTPHVAGASDRSLANMGLLAVRNVLAVLEGEPVDQHLVLNAATLRGGPAKARRKVP